MKLFWWRSEVLRRYDQGYIITLAETEEEAREKILGNTSAYWSDLAPWADPDYKPDRDRYNEWLEKLKKNISEPAMINRTLFIWGSE